MNPLLAACVAVIVDDPAERILRRPPETVATFSLEDVYVQGPGELVVGGTTARVPTP